jgi:ABC-type phosphate/phosphonate transport system permease subunit
MRSATIVGFVAGGGIGFFVVETIRKSGYTQYAAALWAVAIIIMIVDYVSAKWRERILAGTTHVTTEPPRPFYKSLRSWLYIVVGASVFAYSWQLCQINLKELLNPAPTLAPFVVNFISLNLGPEVINTVVREMIATLFQALLATTLGAIVAIPFSFLAARNLTGRSRLSIWIYYLAAFHRSADVRGDLFLLGQLWEFCGDAGAFGHEFWVDWQIVLRGNREH